MDAGPPIDFVTAGAGGRIGMVACPGGPWFQRAAAPAPGEDPLDADLRALRHWGTRILLSLVEQHELDMLGLTAIGARCAAAGLQWRHLPIVDMRAPGAPFEQGWAAVREDLIAVLREGGRIVVHCYAGLGRTGTVAARLLVEMGAPPGAAIEAVRAARPGAIQSRPQELHVLRARIAPGGH